MTSLLRVRLGWLFASLRHQVRHVTVAPVRARTVAWLLAFALAACSDGNGGSDASDGPFAVGIKRFTFVDQSRPTRENNGVPAKPSRTLATTVYYPAEGAPGGEELPDAPALRDGQRFPLIAFAHGLTAVAEVYRLLYLAWVEAGYVVAAPNFPLSNARAGGGPRAGDYVNQPGDVSFVISEMLRLNEDGSSGLEGLIDPERIGASGQSLGGFTTFGVAFNTCCVDRRIRAAAPMAGRLAPYPGGEYFTGIEIPILIIHGDADDTVPYTSATEAYAGANPPKFLATILGGDHIVPYVTVGSNPKADPTRDASLAFFDHYLKGKRGALERLQAVGSLPFGQIESQLE